MLAGLGASAVASGHTSVASPTAIRAALDNIRIDNFGRINDQYYRGGKLEGRDYSSLVAAGIKAIVDLTSSDSDLREPALAKQAGLKFFKLPMNGRVVPTSDEVASFLDIVGDPANQPVYVHCVAGKHRTGVMTAVYRMTEDGWTADQAFREMKQYNFGLDFLHPEYKKFVCGYQPTNAAARATVTAAKRAS